MKVIIIIIIIIIGTVATLSTTLKLRPHQLLDFGFEPQIMDVDF
jgi:hypothetical protein